MRYIAGKPPRANDDWSARMPQLPHPVALERTPVDTRLVTHDGVTIWRLPDEIGFLPRSEVK